MPIPPEAWENATPIFGIRYPKTNAPAKQLPAAFSHIGADIESALIADTATPPGLNYRTGTKAQRLAATPVRDQIWIETDTGDQYIGTGTAWIRISPDSGVLRPTGTGAGGVINADGSVTFTGQTTISVRGCFPVGVQIAQVIVTADGSPAVGPGNFQFLQGTTPVAAGYSFQRTNFDTAVTPIQSTSNSAVQVWNFPAGGGLLDMTISNPGTANRKFIHSRSGGIGTGQMTVAAVDNISTNFDGFQIYGMSLASTYNVRVFRIH